MYCDKEQNISEILQFSAHLNVVSIESNFCDIYFRSTSPTVNIVQKTFWIFL